MQQIFVMLAAAVVFLAAVAADAATLKSEVVVQGERITLGDIFEDVPRPDAVVGEAPSPGRSATYDATYLARIARAHGLQWNPSTLTDHITIRRASTVITAENIQQAVTDAMMERDGLNEGRIDVMLDNRTVTMHLLPELPATVALENFTYDPAQRRFAATAAAPANNPTVRTAVTGRVAYVVEVPVLNKRMRAGDVVSASDISYAEIGREDVADVITDDSNLIGQELRRAIAANKPVKARDIQAPRMITKGAIVTMVLQTPAMTLTAQGRALEEGAKGDVIRIVNTKSNKVVEATVTGVNEVSVPGPGTAVN